MKLFIILFAALLFAVSINAQNIHKQRYLVLQDKDFLSIEGNENNAIEIDKELAIQIKVPQSSLIVNTNVFVNSNINRLNTKINDSNLVYKFMNVKLSWSFKL